MNHAEPPAPVKQPSNPLAVAGFVLNVLAVAVFFLILIANRGGQSTAADIGSVIEGVFEALAAVMFAMLLSGLILLIGSILCLVSLLWRPRRWAVAGLMIPALIVAFVAYDSAKKDAAEQLPPPYSASVISPMDICEAPTTAAV